MKTAFSRSSNGLGCCVSSSCRRCASIWSARRTTITSWRLLASTASSDIFSTLAANGNYWQPTGDVGDELTTESSSIQISRCLPDFFDSIVLAATWRSSVRRLVLRIVTASLISIHILAILSRYLLSFTLIWLPNFRLVYISHQRKRWTSPSCTLSNWGQAN